MLSNTITRYSALASLATILAVWGPDVLRGCQDLAASDTDDHPRFMRLAGPEDAPVSLQTSVARYTDRSRPGPSIDLVSAVHIGEGDYYATLNELFKNYDVVLYELVADEGPGFRKVAASVPRIRFGSCRRRPAIFWVWNLNWKRSIIRDPIFVMPISALRSSRTGCGNEEIPVGRLPWTP